MLYLTIAEISNDVTDPMKTLCILISAAGLSAAQIDHTTPADWALAAELPASTKPKVENRFTIIGSVGSVIYTVEQNGNRWVAGRTSFTVPMIGILQDRAHAGMLKHMQETSGGKITAKKEFKVGKFSGHKYEMKTANGIFHTVHVFARNSLYHFNFSGPSEQLPTASQYFATIKVLDARQPD